MKLKKKAQESSCSDEESGSGDVLHMMWQERSAVSTLNGLENKTTNSLDVRIKAVVDKQHGLFSK